MLIFCPCARPVDAAETEDGSLLLAAMNVSTLTPVSDAFRRQTAVAVQTIPAQVQRVIELAGWRIQLAEFVVDAQPSLVTEHPRGWPPNTTWQNTDAIHFPAERLLVMAEKRRNGQGQIVATTRIAGVLRHELGHAFDMATGGSNSFRSASDEFRIAYSAGVGRMTPDAAKKLAYYLQSSNAGRQEAFAEAFGIALGGGSDVPHEQMFREFFPEVLAFVRRELKAE